MKTKYERKGHIITNLETKQAKDFKTRNAAKRESAKIQRADGGLGCGILRVAKS